MPTPVVFSGEKLYNLPTKTGNIIGGLAQLGERLNGIQEKGIFNVFRKYLN